MTATPRVSGQPLTPPRAAALAGVIFALLMMMSLAVLRVTVPADPNHTGSWTTEPSVRNAVSFALQLAPFAGIAFLWFIGVLRDRLGALEDQFFATVILGSGLLFVASLFGATALAGALVRMPASDSVHMRGGEAYRVIRWATYTFLNVLGIKMAGVFIFSTCTVALRTAIFPRWVAFAGYACGLVLLLVITNWEWIALLFPLWMLVLSTQILIADLRRGRQKPASSGLSAPN